MINIVIPMSGRGSRFKDVGYTLPKPLIDVDGKPMIQKVIENINLNGRYIFLVLKEHYDIFNLGNLLPKFCTPNSCKVIVVEKVTEGAACTCLLAKQEINTEDQLVVANSDQLVEWDSTMFIKQMLVEQVDGGIVSFSASDPKWSFVKMDPAKNLVVEVAEKRVISDQATAGIYWFKHGCDFVEGAESMILKNIRTNNEFYVCPVFNELIQNQKKICSYPVDNMYGLGTPEDLQNFLSKKISI